MSNVNIKNIILPHGLALAPLAGVSDRAFRRVCRACGAELTVSEMVSAKALCYEQRIKKTGEEHFKTASLATVLKEDMPMALQLFGGEPEFMAEAVAMIVSGCYKGCKSTSLPAAIDINMGCPVHKIVSNGEGSALMKDPDLAGRIVEAAVGAAAGLPVTVKLRAGWDKDSINAVEVAKTVESAGAAAVCVHGRTRNQMYSGSSDNGIIGLVKDALKIPVIGNGDVTDGASALKMINETACDGIMIGRGAIGNPFIFAEIIAALSGGEYREPTVEEKINVALLQLSVAAKEKGEGVAVREARKQIALYLRSFRGAAAIRAQINRAESISEVEAALRSAESGELI